MTEPAAPSSSPAALAQRDELLVAAEATVIPTLLALHGRQRQALEALRVCIAALGETAPAGLVAQEAELAVALAATETALRGYEFTQVDAGGGEDVAERAGDASAQGAIVNGGTFYGTVIGYQENQAALISSWACYVCGVDNPPNTSFCFKCSAQLVRMCPECRQNTSMIGSKICGNCGYPFDLAIRRDELRRKIVEQQEILKKSQLRYEELKEIGLFEGFMMFVALVCFVVPCGMSVIGEHVIGLVLLLCLCLIVITIRLVISRGRGQRNKRSEMSARIHQIEQSLIQYRKLLIETSIRKV
ncbi:MAG TPA: zinc ribbon domain-containing protein [Roseiflexaceae bacterium]|nr:zinc ribbon domain-containing protein [Roseiflexaceae bacterium]